MTSIRQYSDDYKRVEKAIKFIETNFKSQPTLEQIAQNVHLSKYHFDRLFKRWAGISPKQFLQFMTLNYTKQKLSESKSVLDASFDAGLSGPGRLHDLFVNFEAMTPGEYKNQASGININYGISHTPFGECLLATTERGICFLGFVDKDNHTRSVDQLFQNWPNANFIKNPKLANSAINQIFNQNHKVNSKPFNLILKGTNFQIKVWQALLNIPQGYIVSYQDIANYIGHPKSYRAVANAIAINPVAFLIPCHRVITKTGEIHLYRWGSARKKAIIGWEAAKVV